MNIQLKSGLKHQDLAISAVNYVFNDVDISYGNKITQNPIINLKDSKIRSNISKIQKGEYTDDARVIPTEYRTYSDTKNVINIDVRMETGTGKTYVYTKLMYELHKNYGFNKFIILVPSTPIREGTKQFISSDYVKRHFADNYVNTKISLNVLAAQNKKKKIFPFAISSYVRATRLEKNIINVLLTNDSMLLSKATMEKSDYDQTLLGNFTQPYKALEETKSIVIIDEPHRFKRNNKAYRCIIEKIKPQAIIRFGATFPELTNGKKDYDNLVYNLGSCESFNDRLIKGVEINYPPELTEDDTPIRLVDIISSPKSVVLRNEITKKRYTLEKGVSLSSISKKFNNIFVNDIGKINDIPCSMELSNGQILKKNDIFYTNVYSSTYQELMIKLALDEHFEKERENFLRKSKIKTLALFFIDSVASFRGENNNGELRQTFERILTEKLKSTIHKIDTEISNGCVLIEYREYLQASLDNVRATNDGYFSEDNHSTDEDIKQKIDMILSNKEKMLSIKNKDGRYNTFRFIFSKWALREGWDNPNIFTIAKLRSSGSDISKIQEVGRGLRLPVDENGNRIENEQFYLNYIIDYSEKNFASKLIAEINSENIYNINLKEQIQKVAKIRGITEKALFIDLYSKDYIDTNYTVNNENRKIFFEEYPEFIKGLKKDKIINKKTYLKPVVSVRKNNFEELRELWNLLNKKYYMKFEEINEDDLINVIIDILKTNIYNVDIITTISQRTEILNGEAKLVNGKIRSYDLDTQLPYNEFLKKVQKVTNIPIQTFHKAMIQYNKNIPIDKKWFTKATLEKFIQKFHEWEQSYFIHRFSYQQLDVNATETALTDVNGNVRDTILQADVGVFSAPYNISDKFLFDKLIYDSSLEKINIISSDISEIIVYGKIPRRSIKIPVCWGGTYSPDFMYIIKNADGSIQYNFILETKSLDYSDSMRGDEKKKILCGMEFFKQLQADGYNVIFKEQLKTDNIIAMIKHINKQ